MNSQQLFISGSTTVDVDVDKLFQTFRYSFSILQLQNILKNLKCNEYALVGDAIVHLAAICNQVSKNEQVTEHHYGKFCQNQYMADFLRENNLFIPERTKLGSHSLGTIYESVICAIFLYGNDRDQALVNALDACFGLVKGKLDLSMEHVQRCRYKNHKILELIGDDIIKVYFRYQFMESIRDARALPADKFQHFITKKMAAENLNFANNLSLKNYEIGEKFLSDDISRISSIFF